MCIDGRKKEEEGGSESSASSADNFFPQIVFDLTSKCVLDVAAKRPFSLSFFFYEKS